MTDRYANLEAAVESQIANLSTVTLDSIRSLIEQCRIVPLFAVEDEQAARLTSELATRHANTNDVGDVLMERNFKPWLENALKDITPYYWERYRKLLVSRHFPTQVIQTMGKDTERTLGLLDDPRRDGPWSRRGMVVGHVQSGKTANYTGLICKAADAGYRLIVVIAGVHNNLRNQTQKRVDEGFVGRDSARLLNQKEERYIGVGKFDATRRPITFTNSHRDFNKQMATGVGVPLDSLKEPAVFVIKKNASTLQNLIDWLKEHNASHGASMVSAPMLLIDDEADNASINVKYGRAEVARINGQIRELLQLFSRSCYVGYTATPFANIFIDPDTDDEMYGQDLFPRHFIISLDPPSNYFGPDRVFRERADEVVRHIEDAEPNLPLTHPKDHMVAELPASLQKAVRTFVLARAVRQLRGHSGIHTSMLVNASRFTMVQKSLSSAISDFLDAIKANVRLYAALTLEEAAASDEITALRNQWEEEYASTEFPWSSVQGVLIEAASPVRVVEVNSRSHGTLNYDDYMEDGLHVIAVGGFSLSRGLTLEGLMVSYFLRNSMMYDTLMQMGRWFGYRDGYEDLCRVWMPEEAEGWYAHIAESVELLREEFRKMSVANATPEEFGLKVRAHPDALIVTARNKMGSGERVTVSIGLGNQFVETAILRADTASLETNRNNLRRFSRELAGAGISLDGAEHIPGGRLIRDVPVNPVVEFLASFRNHPLSMLSDPAPIVQYVRDRSDTELAYWDVMVPSLESSAGTRQDSSLLGISINCQRRRAGSRSDEHTLRITNKQRVASRGVEKAGLLEGQIQEAEHDFRRDNGYAADAKVNFPDRIYRHRRERPLLILHVLQILEKETRAPLDQAPVVAWSISFPSTHYPEKRVEYVVTTTWLRENMRADLDGDEFESDDN